MRKCSRFVQTHTVVKEYTRNWNPDFLGLVPVGTPGSGAVAGMGFQVENSRSLWEVLSCGCY